MFYTIWIFKMKELDLAASGSAHKCSCRGWFELIQVL